MATVRFILSRLRRMRNITRMLSVIRDLSNGAVERMGIALCFSHLLSFYLVWLAGFVDFLIANRRSLEESGLYKWDIARRGLDLEHLRLVASLACCHSRERRVLDLAVRGLLGSGGNRPTIDGRRERNV